MKNNNSKKIFKLVLIMALMLNFMIPVSITEAVTLDASDSLSKLPNRYPMLGHRIIIIF